MQHLDLILLFVLIWRKISVVLDLDLNPFANFLQTLYLIKELDILIL